MKTTVLSFALTTLLAAAHGASAQPAVVEAVQYPAWLERGGNAVPLAPGTALQAQDRLRTGGKGKVRSALLGSGTILREVIAAAVLKIYQGAIEACQTGKQVEFPSGKRALANSAKAVLSKLRRSGLKWPKINRELHAITYRQTS